MIIILPGVSWAGVRDELAISVYQEAPLHASRFNI